MKPKLGQKILVATPDGCVTKMEITHLGEKTFLARKNAIDAVNEFSYESYGVAWGMAEEEEE